MKPLLQEKKQLGNKRMALQTKYHSVSLRKHVFVGIVVMLSIGILLVILEKTNTINIIDKPGNAKTTGPNRLPGVNYNPPTENQRQEIERRKTEIIQNEQSNGIDSTISVRITNAVQDTPGGPAFISTVLSGIRSGTCSLSLRKDSTVINRSADIMSAGTYYSCDGFQVEYNSLSPGTWNVSVTVKSLDGKSNETTTSLEIR